MKTLFYYNQFQKRAQSLIFIIWKGLNIMELIKEAVTVGEILFSDSFEAAADGDLIVPDIKPDILKVLQVDATSCISSKEISDGKLILGGRVNLTVLYLPDTEDGGVQSIKTTFEFSHKLDRPSIDESCSAIVDSDVSRVEFHVINSRKISLRAAILIDCEIISAREIAFPIGIDDECAQVLTTPITVNALCGVHDDEFMIKEGIEIPAGKASIGEILKIDYKLCDKEFKAITEKLVVKGILNVCILYTDTNGCIEHTEADIPFTEVFDFPGITEDMTCELNYRICDCYYDVAEDSDGDRRIVNIELLVCAEMKASEMRELEIISDCFLPGFETNITYFETEFNEITASPSCQNTLRDSAVTDKNQPQITGVYNVISRAVITSSRTEENKLSTEGKIEACILYLSDSAQTPVYSFKKEIPFSYLLDSPGTEPGMSCCVAADVSHTSFHLNAANEVELRYILNISASIPQRRTLSLIDDVETEEIPKNKKKGIVIYFVQPGDTLWSISKNYFIPPEQLAEFNQLNAKNPLNPGQQLIIPAQKSH